MYYPIRTTLNTQAELATTPLPPEKVNDKAICDTDKDKTLHADELDADPVTSIANPIPQLGPIPLKPK